MVGILVGFLGGRLVGHVRRMLGGHLGGHLYQMLTRVQAHLVQQILALLSLRYSP